MCAKIKPYFYLDPGIVLWPEKIAKVKNMAFKTPRTSSAGFTSTLSEIAKNSRHSLES